MPENLPNNLTAYPSHGYTLYRYQFPDGQRKGLGSNRDEAVRIANVLNEQLAPIKDQLAVEKILSPSRKANSTVFTRFVAAYKKDMLYSKELGYSKNSLQQREWKLAEYCRVWYTKPVHLITTYDIAQFLKFKTQESSRQHRNVLMQLFTYGMEEGLINVNPVAGTMKRKQPKRLRHRHTWAGYNVILSEAEPWLARTMKLALYSLQRRGDIVGLHKNKIDMANRTIRVRQEKTGVNLLISMGDDLYQVIHECLNTGILCPYLVHTRPKRMTKTIREAKLHPFAVTKDHLTREFNKARDRAGAYTHLPKGVRPTFHDLRALGIFALSKAGYPVDYIQGLAGHADEAMTQRYLVGHEQIKPVKVEAGLSIESINWAEIDWKD